MYQAILFVFAVAILGLLKTFLDKEEDQTKANNCHSIPSASDSTSKIAKLSLDQPAAKSDSLVQSKTIMMDSEVSIDELAPIAKVKPSIRVAPTAIIAAQAQVKPVQIRTEELNLDQNEQIMQDHTFVPADGIEEILNLQKQISTLTAYLEAVQSKLDKYVENTGISQPSEPFITKQGVSVSVDTKNNETKTDLEIHKHKLQEQLEVHLNKRNELIEQKPEDEVSNILAVLIPAPPPMPPLPEPQEKMALPIRNQEDANEDVMKKPQEKPAVAFMGELNSKLQGGLTLRKSQSTKQAKEKTGQEKTHEVNFKGNLKPTRENGDGSSCVPKVAPPLVEEKATNPLFEDIKRRKARRQSMLIPSKDVLPENSLPPFEQILHVSLKKRETKEVEKPLFANETNVPGIDCLKPALKHNSHVNGQNEPETKFSLPFKTKLRPVQNKPAWCTNLDSKPDVWSNSSNMNATNFTSVANSCAINDANKENLMLSAEHKKLPKTEVEQEVKSIDKTGPTCKPIVLRKPDLRDISGVAKAIEPFSVLKEKVAVNSSGIAEASTVTIVQVPPAPPPPPTFFKESSVTSTTSSQETERTALSSAIRNFTKDGFQNSNKKKNITKEKATNVGASNRGALLTQIQGFRRDNLRTISKDKVRKNRSNGSDADDMKNMIAEALQRRLSAYAGKCSQDSTDSEDNTDTDAWSEAEE